MACSSVSNCKIRICESCDFNYYATIVFLSPFISFSWIFWMLNTVSFYCSNPRLLIVVSFILCWKNSVFTGYPWNGGSWYRCFFERTSSANRPPPWKPSKTTGWKCICYHLRSFGTWDMHTGRFLRSWTCKMYPFWILQFIMNSDNFRGSYLIQYCMCLSFFL